MVEINKIKGRGMQFSGRLERPDEVVYGLKAYYADNYAFDDYLYWLEGDPAVYIQCASIKMDIPYPSCDMVWDYSDSISFNASFSKKYLSNWKRVLEKVNKLIKVTSTGEFS
jgi:hypothetical protein